MGAKEDAAMIAGNQRSTTQELAQKALEFFVGTQSFHTKPTDSDTSWIVYHSLEGSPNIAIQVTMTIQSDRVIAFTSSAYGPDNVIPPTDFVTHTTLPSGEGVRDYDDLNQILGALRDSWIHAKQLGNQLKDDSGAAGAKISLTMKFVIVAGTAAFIALIVSIWRTFSH